MNTRTQAARGVVSMLLALTMMSVVTHSIAGSADAEEQAVEWLGNRGLHEGWDDRLKRVVFIGRAGFDTPNPKFNNPFTARQSLAASSAVLDARIQVIEFVSMETVSAEFPAFETTKPLSASTNAGTVETRAAGKLYGAIPIAKFESWDKDRDQYEVATVVMWSLAFEKLVRSAMRGESVRVPLGSLSLEQFALGFEKEKRVNIGGRFRDDKGVIYILGAGFAAVEGGQSLSTARVLAEQNAREEILMAIYSDISSHKKADREGGFEHDIAVRTFEGYEGQRVNRQIRKLFGGRVVDPISQQPVYATVFALSLDDYAKSALE